MKILIKNGLIVDGNLGTPYIGEVLIENEKISEIGVKLNTGKVDRIIDATGLVVSPGFIDTHTHSDLKILETPYNEVKARQGITTEILGQDGISMAPLPLEYISAWRKNLAGLDGVSDKINWEYRNTDGYLNQMAKGTVGLNYAYLVPHGNVRMEAMGLDGVPANDDQIRKMCEITRREMEAGAFGLSTGLIYIPCAYAETKELIEMCKVVAEYDGALVIHQRSEADTILESMNEVIEIGKKSGVRIHFSHFKVCGKNNWKFLDQVMELLEQAQKDGVKVSCDQYPYPSGSTMLGVVLPPWAHAGGTNKLMERLKNTADRAKIKEDIKNGIPGWDNFMEFAGLEHIFVTSVKNPKNYDAVGKSLIELGDMKQKDPIDATLDLLLEEENAVGMLNFYGHEDHVIRILKRPETNVCTDALLAPGKPHPRAYGSFPRVIARYVRENPVLKIEEAVYKMTKKAAEAMRLKNRGELKVGNYADITIFDLETIKDTANYLDPIKFPDGILYVIVNGTPIIDNKEFKEVAPGHVIRRSQLVSTYLLGNAIIITQDKNNPYIENGAILIQDDKIADIGLTLDLKVKYQGAEFIDVGRKILMPGFINTHHHIYSSFARGMSNSRPTRNFDEILENLWWKVDKTLTNEDTKYSAYATLIESVKNGVTTVIDHHASPLAIEGSLKTIADVASEIGIRASLCYEVSDRDGLEIADKGIKENIEFIKWAESQNSDMIRGLFGLHAAFTLSNETLEKCKNAMKDLNAGYHVHVAEGYSDLTFSLKNY
ncbi:MAG: amidohydrolase family protein, partial [Fusobacteriaceae bacterium]